MKQSKLNRLNQPPAPAGNPALPAPGQHFTVRAKPGPDEFAASSRRFRRRIYQKTAGFLQKQSKVSSRQYQIIHRGS